MKEHTARLAWLAIFLLITGTMAFGQAAQLTGQVTDARGASIPTASIVATNVATGIAAKTVTTAEGFYTLPGLPPGNYALTVEKSGFGTTTRSSIVLNIAQNARLNVTLQVGTQVQHVAVGATVAPLLQSESPTLGTVIGSRQVVDLPLNGRNFLQLATLTPGVMSGGTGFFLANNIVRVNGMDSSNTNYEIDGIMARDQSFSGTTMMPPPDSIQEFKVQSNVLASQYGLAGAVVSVALKSGTNNFHGDAYEFFRNDKLDARNFFALSKGTLRQNQFGGSLGGPIKKNKTFFFGDYEGTRIRNGVTFNSVVPTVAEREGNFSGQAPIIDPSTGSPFANNQIPSEQFSQQATFFLKFIPTPNAPGGTYVQTPTSPETRDQFNVKVDHQLRAGDSLTTSYSYLNDSIYNPGPFPQVGGENDTTKAQLISAGWTHTFGPRVLNELKAGYNRNVLAGVQQGAGTNYTDQSGIGGFEVTSGLFPGFPGLSISGFQGLPGNYWRPFKGRENSWLLRDSLTLIKGSHTLKIGGNARWLADDSENAGVSRGSFHFNGKFTGSPFADYLLGLPFSGTRTFPRNLFGSYERQQGVYAADEWKATSRLTFTLGLGYQLLHPATFLHNQAAMYDPFTNQLIVASNAAGQISTNTQQVTAYVLPLVSDLIVPSSKAGLPPSLRFMTHDDFEPRAGLAWSPRNDWAVRLGYGITHTLEEHNRIDSINVVSPPFIADESGFFNTGAYTMANLFPPITPQGYDTGPVAFYYMDPHRKDPYFQQWNVTVEKLIRNVMSIEASYVGNKGTYLSFANNLNVPDPGPGNIQARRMQPAWGAGTYIEDSNNTIYHALQVSAQMRAWHGLTLLGTYTYSKALDYQAGGDSQGGSVQDFRNPQLERGLTDQDVPHRFTLGGVYALPFLKNNSSFAGHALGGWRITSIMVTQAGFPFTPTIETDSANTGTSMRPNRVGSGILANPTINDWFNVSDFQVPPFYTYGDSGVNILRGPWTTDWDFGLYKEFRLPKFIGEGAHLEFRSEFFNFTNSPRFGNPVADIQSPAGGEVLSSDTPREVQFALKLIF